MLHKEDAGWSNPKVLTTFGLIFLCGLAFGVLATSSYFHSKIRPAVTAGQVNMNQLRTELHLSPEQEKTIMKELDDYGKFYQTIEEERADVARNGKANILKVLNPEQQKLFLKIFSFPTPALSDCTHAP